MKIKICKLNFVLPPVHLRLQNLAGMGFFSNEKLMAKLVFNTIRNSTQQKTPNSSSRFSRYTAALKSKIFSEIQRNLAFNKMRNEVFARQSSVALKIRQQQKHLELETFNRKVKEVEFEGLKMEDYNK